MMSGPFPFARETMPLDDLLKQVGGPGWSGLDLARAFAPAKVSDRFEPDEDLKKFLAAFSRTQQGRTFFNWIADLTVRAPYPHVGTLRETAALAAAKHEARCGVGQVIFAAVEEGERLLNTPREPGT